MILAKCPKCGNNQKCNPVGTLAGKRKACVYCGKSFLILNSIHKKI